MMWVAKDCSPSYRVYHDIIRALAATRILNVELLREKPSHPSSGQRTREAPSLPPLRARPDRSLAHLSAVHSRRKILPPRRLYSSGKEIPHFQSARTSYRHHLKPIQIDRPQGRPGAAGPGTSGNRGGRCPPTYHDSQRATSMHKGPYVRGTALALHALHAVFSLQEEGRSPAFPFLRTIE